MLVSPTPVCMEGRCAKRAKTECARVTALDSVCYEIVFLQCGDARTLGALACASKLLRRVSRSWRVAPHIEHVRAIMARRFKAVRHNGWALRKVPVALRTPELCLAAVRQNGIVLMDVPKALRTREVCLAAVCESGCALGDVPLVLRTPELCLIAVRKNGYVFDKVPLALRTKELSMVALRHYPGASVHEAAE
jgi:hypothetical protein